MASLDAVIARLEARGTKRARQSSVESASDDDEEPFVLVDDVFTRADLRELQQFYAAALEAARAQRDGTARGELRFKARERGTNKFDVEFDGAIELSFNAQERLERLLDTSLLEPAQGPDDTATWLYSKPHALVTLGGAPPQAWHTDVDALCSSDDEDEDECAYYYTLLVNVGEQRIVPDMGPTEFVRGDDVPDLDDESDDDTVLRPLLAPNQGVLFGGKIVHRGGAASEPREPTVYIVLHRRWYRDLNAEQFEEMQLNL